MVNNSQPAGKSTVARIAAAVRPRGGGFDRQPNWPLYAALGLVALVAVGYLVASVFTRSVVYYLTPTEVLASPGKHVRVSGSVVPGSIGLAPNPGTVSFLVTDGKSSVKVVFQGAAPDTLKDGAQAVAEGTLGGDGVFHASQVLAKCPSKFESKKPGP